MINSSIRSQAATTLFLFTLLTALLWVPWSLRQQAAHDDREPHLTSRPTVPILASQTKPFSRADQTSIRVTVTSIPQKQLELSIDGPYQFRPVGSDKVLSRGETLSSTSVTATTTGLRIGKSEYAVERLEIVPRQSPSVWVNGHEYRGLMRLFRRSGGFVLAVNVLPLAD